MATEKRRYPRFECEGSASILTGPDQDALSGRIVNISANGCLILLKDSEKLDYDSIVELNFRINDIPFRVWGKVKVARSATAYGFEFPLLSERVRKRLENLITELIEDFLTVKSMRSMGERRRHPRFECSGEAGVLLSAGEELIPAKLVNLSAGGCLLEFDEPRKLERDATVELRFHLDDQPLQMKGAAKSMHAENQIGFQFLQSNRSVRRRLDELINDLIERVIKRLTAPVEE
jgi:c-di-GMP-binding flagellar brake protein YcgR